MHCRFSRFLCPVKHFSTKQQPIGVKFCTCVFSQPTPNKDKNRKFRQTHLAAIISRMVSRSVICQSAKHMFQTALRTMYPKKPAMYHVCFDGTLTNRCTLNATVDSLSVIQTNDTVSLFYFLCLYLCMANKTVHIMIVCFINVCLLLLFIVCFLPCCSFWANN